MKRIIFSCVLICSYFWSYSQIIHVRDINTREPVSFAQIISVNPSVQVATDILGKADISAFKGVTDIQIRSLIYKSKSLSFEAIQQANFIVYLEESNIHMSEVVVSASKWGQNSNDVASKVTRISTEQIAIQNPQTAADLLGISGQVFIQKSQQGGGSPMIRGFATNRLLYSIDGVRMNTAIFRGGNIQNVISIDPFAIENTEVLFGPGSVIYGSDAIGGVMSFQTLKPRFSSSSKAFITGNVNARYSTANEEETVHFDVNIGWKKWALLTSISTFNYDDLRMGSYGPYEYERPFYVQRQDSVDVVVINRDTKIQIPSGYSQQNFMQKIRFMPNDKLDFEYGFHLSETSEYSRYDRHIRYKDGLPRYGEWKYGPQKWMMNQFSMNHYSEARLYDQLNLRAAYQKFEESRISRDFNKNDRETRTEYVHALSLNLDFQKRLLANNVLNYGIEALTNEVISTGVDTDISTGISQEGPSRYPQASWTSMGVYLANQHDFSPKWTLNTGLRYNFVQILARFDTRFYEFPFTEANTMNNALTGSVGIIFKPVENIVVRSNLATAFRSPNVDDIGKVFDSEPGAVVVPNPDLRPEYAYNADIGMAWLIDERFKIDFSAYYTYLDHALVRRNFTLNGQDSILYSGSLSQVQAIQNAAFAKVYGFQLGLDYEIVENVILATNINVQNGEEELDDGSLSPSRHAAPLFGSTAIKYKTEKLSLQLDANYSAGNSFEELPISEQSKTEIYAIDDNGNPYSPAWVTLNFKALYKINQDFSISAGMENLMDIRYRPYSSGIVAPGRNFIISGHLNF